MLAHTRPHLSPLLAFLILLQSSPAISHQEQSVSAKTYHEEGNRLSDQGNYSTALTAYTQAIRLQPIYAEAYCDRGVAYRLLGKYSQALADFEQSIRCDAKYAPAYNNRAYTLRLKEDYSRAILAYKEAIRLQPHSGVRWMHLAVCEYLAERYSDAIRSNKKALVLGGNQTEVRFNLGLVYAVKGSWRNAEREYIQCLRNAKPEQMKQAIEEAEAAQKKHPRSKTLRRALTLLKRASSLP